MSWSLSGESGTLFGVDSKTHIRQRQLPDGSVRELFRANLGVVVNPMDIEYFEKKYDEIMTALFNQYGMDRKRRVYKSAAIGKLLSGRDEDIRNFHIAFGREMLNLSDVRYNICFTQLNSRYLNEGLVTIFGKYGQPTRKVDAKRFINILDNYYNVVCAWKVLKITGLRECTFFFDGMESVYPTQAWHELIEKSNILIIYSGDNTSPLLSSADIILKYLDILLKLTRRRLNEESLHDIIIYDDKVDPDNKYYHYIGNPDIQAIKPLEDRLLGLRNLEAYIKRPIVFISKGSLPGQRAALENLPIYDTVYNKAHALHASVRVYDPYKDSNLIGRDPSRPDYFLPLTKEADEQFELLSRGGANVLKLEL